VKSEKAEKAFEFGDVPNGWLRAGLTKNGNASLPLFVKKSV